MVVKIQPAAESVSNATEYNERKMSGPEGVLDAELEGEYLGDENTGHILETVNVPETSTLDNEFNRLRLLNRRSTKGRPLEFPAFHMSINPGKQDMPMDEASVVAFTHELMESLGYGDSPYRLYRHDDTGRTHYHVVSSRIGQDGKKIKDSFENARCESICRSLAVKYGFVYGLDDEMEVLSVQPESKVNEQPAAAPASRTEDTKAVREKPRDRQLQEKEPEEQRKKWESGNYKNKQDKLFVAPFDKNSRTDRITQFINIHREAMTWSFSTPEQYGALLRWRFNTGVKMYNDQLYYIGLDENGNGCVPPVSETQLHLPAMDQMLQHCVDADIKSKRKQRERLQRLAEWAIENSKSWEAFRKTLERKGVYLSVSWSEDDEPFGITWIDRGTKTIWKGSETKTDLSWLKGKCEEKGWAIKRSWKHERIQPATEGKPEREHKSTQQETAVRAASAPQSGSLSSITIKDAFEQLLQRRGINKSKASNVDASKTGRRNKFGEEDNEIEIVI